MKKLFFLLLVLYVGVWAQETRRLYIEEIIVAARKPTGKYWDALRGAPDLRVIIFVRHGKDWQPAYISPVMKNFYKLASYINTEIDVGANTELIIEVWDKDVSCNDIIGNCLFVAKASEFEQEHSRQIQFGSVQSFRYCLSKYKTMLEKQNAQKLLSLQRKYQKMEQERERQRLAAEKQRIRQQKQKLQQQQQSLQQQQQQLAVEKQRIQQQKQKLQQAKYKHKQKAPPILTAEQKQKLCTVKLQLQQAHSIHAIAKRQILLNTISQHLAPLVEQIPEHPQVQQVHEDYEQLVYFLEYDEIAWKLESTISYAQSRFIDYDARDDRYSAKLSRLRHYLQEMETYQKTLSQLDTDRYRQLLQTTATSIAQIKEILGKDSHSGLSKDQQKIHHQWQGKGFHRTIDNNRWIYASKHGKKCVFHYYQFDAQGRLTKHQTENLSMYFPIRQAQSIIGYIYFTGKNGEVYIYNSAKIKISMCDKTNLLLENLKVCHKNDKRFEAVIRIDKKQSRYYQKKKVVLGKYEIDDRNITIIHYHNIYSDPNSRETKTFRFALENSTEEYADILRYTGNDVGSKHVQHAFACGAAALAVFRH